MLFTREIAKILFANGSILYEKHFLLKYSFKIKGKNRIEMNYTAPHLLDSTNKLEVHFYREIYSARKITSDFTLFRRSSKLIYYREIVRNQIVKLIYELRYKYSVVRYYATVKKMNQTYSDAELKEEI